MPTRSGTPGAEEARPLAAILRAVVFPVRPAFAPVCAFGLRFDVVSTPAGLLDVFRLRCFAYTACGYIDAADYPASLEFDIFDDVSVHFDARDAATGALVGCTRLILDVRERLQVDELLDISDYRARYPGRLCEMSRLIVYPVGRPGVSRGLRYLALRWAELNGIECVLGASRVQDQADYDRRGFVPMTPDRRVVYAGRLAGLRGTTLYGNVLDMPHNRDAIRALVPATEDAQPPR